MNILIVESKAKSKTIQKYLGKDWVVLATGGHIQELPNRAFDPKEGKKAFWANRKGELPAPPWMWTDNGEKAVNAILAAAEKHGDPKFFLAPDPDREGEFIAWRLQELLSEHGPCVRVTFREVTKGAIAEAVEDAHEVDMDRVRSAMVRRFLDRLVGFRASKMAKSFVTSRTASMGRVQTPTLGFIVERELEREAHVPVPFFEVSAGTDAVDLQVRFHEPSDENRWTDDKQKFVATRTSDTELAEGAFAAIAKAGAVSVTKVKPTERSQKPKPAFTTDALLQAAGGRWGWSPKKTMSLAGKLYEGGHITYLRTDSIRLSDQAIADARALIKDKWDEAHLGAGAAGKKGATKVQDAHEAIRPTQITVLAPEGVDDDARRLYTLIRAQVLASQMAPAKQARLGVTASVPDLDRPLTGSVSWYTSLGWRAAFVGIDAAASLVRPDGLEVGASLVLLPEEEESPNPNLKRGETQPPGRYRGHSLVKAMKDAGIGRPSTYASTLETLLRRKYVEDEGGALVPLIDGRRVWLDVAPMYSLTDGEPLFDPTYTATMEERLDDVEEGTEAAPEVWETLRDAFRAAHDSAQKQRKAGHQTASQRMQIDALFANAPAEMIEGVDVDGLSWEGAGALIRTLREAGVSPTPSEKQLVEITRLSGLLGLDDAAVAALIELENLEALRTRAEASSLIDALKQRMPEVTAVSDKQQRFLADLVKKAGLTEAEACAQVGAADYAALTGGRAGTASQLITLMKRAARKA
ncbi:MAG: type IA DNA topoisomerase [Proteobacteria bacterium]|nr:type IA DNA topoisomerase [Pseudomonadota bacterium]